MSVIGFLDRPLVPGRAMVTNTDDCDVAPWLSVIVYEKVSLPYPQPRGS